MADIKVGRFDDIVDGGHKVYATSGREVGIFRVGTKLFAWENHCPHAGGPICQGRIFGRIGEELTPDKRSLGLFYTGEKHIVCPWHGFEFNVETGRHPGNESTRLKGFPVDVRDGDVWLKLPG
jgi:nitrite reductase (NADH) small subunit